MWRGCHPSGATPVLFLKLFAIRLICSGFMRSRGVLPAALKAGLDLEDNVGLQCLFDERTAAHTDTTKESGVSPWQFCVGAPM